jgi:hypothetical protein
MAPDLSRIISQALALPNEARAALAGALLESLGDTVDEKTEAEWAAEIARRIAELDRPEGKVLAWPE